MIYQHYSIELMVKEMTRNGLKLPKEPRQNFKQIFHETQQIVKPIDHSSIFQIDKGSPPVNHILGCSSGKTSRTRTIYISYERLYFSPSYGIQLLIF